MSLEASLKHAAIESSDLSKAARRRRIVVIPSDYPDFSNPRLLNHVWAEEQSRALMADHDIAVVYPLMTTERSGRIDEYNRQGIPTLLVRYRHIPKTWIGPYVFAAWRGVKRAAGGNRPECIHAHDLYPAGFAAVLIGRALGIPTVITEHWGQTATRTARNRLIYRALRFTLRQATRVIAVSKFLAEELQRLEPKSSVVIVPNMVSPLFFETETKPVLPSRNEIKLLFVGSLRDSRKGLDRLLRALKLYLDSSAAPNCRLIVIGEGSRRREFERMAADLGIGGYCEFRGNQTREEVATAMVDCDVYVMPSRYETFGLVYAEAMACGKPVVACRNGPAEEIVPPWAGALTPPDDDEALMQAIADVASNLANYDSSKISAYARRQFGSDAVVAAISEVYEKVINKNTNASFRNQ